MPPRLQHVKYVKRRGKTYAYFNTGQKRDGKPIYAPLPAPSSVGFFDSYAALKAGRSKRAVKRYTVAVLAEQYEASQDFARKALNTRRLYSSQLARITEFWGKFPVDDLQRRDITGVLDGERWNPGTRNMVLAVLGLLYKWARRSGATSLDPVKDIEREKGGTHAPWPEDVLEAALASDSDLVRLAVHLLYFTGQRIGDVIAMRWNDIRAGVLYVTPQKTRRFAKRLSITLHAELRAELARTPRRGITILHGVTDRQLRAVLQGFTLGHGAVTVPHGLRKNAVNALLEAGCTIAEVAAITGQTYQVVEHYAAHVNTAKLGKAAMLKFEARRRENE